MSSILLSEILKYYKSVINNDTITFDEIKTLEKNCNKYLEGLNVKFDILIKTFNNLLMEITNLLLSDLPKIKEIQHGRTKLSFLINTNYVEPISLFILHIYKYDDYVLSIKNGNDDFFLQSSSNNVIKRHGDKNAEKIKKIFQFRYYWNDIKFETKETIKAIMKVMVDITTKYIEIKDDGNKITEILKNITKYDVTN